MKQAFWFILGGLTLGSGALASAAVGDLIVLKQETAKITPAQAAGFADAAISAGCWSGNRANMQILKIRRSGADFYCYVEGTDTIAPGDVPANAGELRVVGRVE